jgi:hypothetical protein
MGKLNNYKRITNNDNDYAVCELNYNGNNVPVIMDWNIFKTINKMDKNWHINDKGMVVTNHKFSENGVEKMREIYLHDIVMKLFDDKYENRSILHINKLGVDNRKCNLMYDTCNKDIFKNIKKKSRTITLPEDCGVTPEELPSYVWYLKEDDTHGERFIVNIGDVQWKSTSSKKVSLRYKLEETKKYLRFLKETRNDLFNDYSMNGDLNNDGLNLIKSFVKISRDAGFTNINDISDTKNTNKYISENIDGLTEEEIILLGMFDPKIGKLDFR